MSFHGKISNLVIFKKKSHPTLEEENMKRAIYFFQKISKRYVDDDNSKILDVRFHEFFIFFQNLGADRSFIDVVFLNAKPCCIS